MGNKFSHNIHESFMEIAIGLAQKGIGKVSPNPLVGCIIVKDGEIIGEGYHKEFGRDHAEVMAYKNATKNPDGSTLYVTLEPCSIHGKTPPCTEFLIANGIRSIYVGMIDPNPKVNGRGINILRFAGIDVQVGVLQKECTELNKGYNKWINLGIPWVIVKAAESSDGFMGIDSRTKTKITDEEALSHSHSLRSKVDAILIGRQTALVDNPKLTVRRVIGPNPIRVILDTNRTLPLNLNIFKDKKAETLIVCSDKKFKNNRTAICEYLACKENSDGLLDVQDILKNLGDIGITTLLIEGGAKTIESFISNKLVDEIYLYTSTEKIINGRLKTPINFNDEWDILDVLHLGHDNLQIARKKNLCLQES